MSKISEIVDSKKHYEGINLMERMEECHISAISIAIIENFEIRDEVNNAFKKIYGCWCLLNAH